MDENNAQNPINLSFDEFQNLVYNYTLINSIVFSLDITKFINDLSGFDQYDPNYVFKLFESWLNNQPIENFDQKIKSNTLYIAEYLLERSNELSKEDKVDKLNYTKKFLNQCSDNNLNFLKEQVANRYYGLNYNDISNHNKTKYILSDESVAYNKEVIYDSINSDVNVLNTLIVDQDEFYDGYYKKYLLSKKFYQSINYFFVEFSPLFVKLDYLKRICYIMQENLKLIHNGEVTSDIYDSEFENLVDVSAKTVKKFSKQMKAFIK